MKNNRYTLTDHEKKRFSFWAIKKDGNDSAPFSQFKSMELKSGDTVRIGYVIEEYDSEFGRKQSNKIINFQETNDNPTQDSQTEKSSNTGQSTAPQSYSGRNFEREAYEKCCSLWASAHFQKSNDSKIFLQGLEEGVFWTVFQAIKADGEKRFTPEPAGKAALRQRFGQEVAPDIAEMAEQMSDEPPVESYDDLPPF